MEKITGFTPGPWITRPDKLGNMISIESEFPSEEQLNNEDTSICGIWFNYYKDKKEDFANAQLIALAPTLYEQHFKMLEALKSSIDDIGLILLNSKMDKKSYSRIEALRIKMEQATNYEI